MEASNVPTSSDQGAQVFTLDALGMSSQAKSTASRIKVDKTFELTKEEGVRWFVDTYDMDANYKGDIHLYLSQGDMKYGDMGIVVSVKDDVDATAMPCFACNVLPVGETTKANKFCLSLDSFHVADMNGSKLGKDNSIVKLGLKISSFTNQEDSGVDCVEDLVKAVKHAKRTLSLPKRALPGNKPTVVPSKKDVEKTGKAMVKSAVAASRKGTGVSSSKHAERVVIDIGSQKVPSSSAKGSHDQDPQRLIKKRKAKDVSTIEEDQQNLATRKMTKSAEDKVFLEEENMEIETAVEDNKAMTSLEVKMRYYPFGINEVFSIDVTRCFPAPSSRVYRRLNPDWVKILTLDFIQEPKQEEILAILMPFDPSTKSPLEKLAKEDIHNVHYWIISGQHSISAAKRLQGAKVAKVTPQLRQQFKYRRAKIILNCPPKISREISKDANLSVAMSMQKEPFLDQLMQARAQWIANGRPSKPPPSINETKMKDLKDIEAWKVLV